MLIYEIHTLNKMYTIEAHHFTVIKFGVMFFNDKNEGIGFVPNGSLDLLRVGAKEEKTLWDRKEYVDKLIR